MHKRIFIPFWVCYSFTTFPDDLYVVAYVVIFLHRLREVIIFSFQANNVTSISTYRKTSSGCYFRKKVKYCLLACNIKVDFHFCSVLAQFSCPFVPGKKWNWVKSYNVIETQWNLGGFLRIVYAVISQSLLGINHHRNKVKTR